MKISFALSKRKNEFLDLLNTRSPGINLFLKIILNEFIFLYI